MRDTFVCDLCNARVKETGWEHKAAGLYLNVYLPCSNPMGAVSTNGNWQRSEIEYDEVCNDCREAVAAQIAAAVKSRMAKADPPPSLARQHSVEGEEIMVNTPYDVFTLPLQPSGLSSGPRFVVHVPGPEQPAAVDGSDAQAAEIEALRAEVDALREALEDIRSSCLSRRLLSTSRRSNHENGQRATAGRHRRAQLPAKQRG